MNTSTDAPRSMGRHVVAVLWAVFGFVAVGAALLASIFRFTSSTAVIGILFIPFYAAPFVALFYLFGYCVPDLLVLLKRKAIGRSHWIRLRAGVAVILLGCAVSYLTYGILLTVTVNEVRTLDERGLDEFLETSIFRNNRYALGAVAQNPNASASLLDRVARLPNPELHHPMGSVWPVMGENGKGLAVMRLIAMHKNVSEATLVKLSKSPDDFVLGAVAANSKTPLSIIREFSEKGVNLVDWGLAVNPNAPADILEEIAATGDEYARSSVASNSGTSVEALVQLAKDPVWHVRRGVASNAHTPVETIESLGDDPDERVRSVAAYRLGEIKQPSR